MDPLASLVSRAERSGVQARAERLHEDAQAQDWPGPRAARLRRRICFVVAAIAPELPAGRLSVLARYALWSFLLDDQLDASGLDPDPLARIRDAVREVAAGGRAGGGDPLLAGLAHTLDELAGYDPAGELVGRFREAVRDAVAAEVEQVLLGRAVAEGGRPPPTPEQYLELAARTANYRSFAFVLLAVVAGSLSSSTLDRIDPALWHAARAVRLGNDLRSVGRDRSQSGLNIVDLRTAAGAPVTRRQVHADVDRSVRAHDELLAVVGEVGPAVPALRRSLRITVGLFRIADVRAGSAV